ncbi:solute carrier family 35 member F1-like [Pyrus ussuriensis x Pyrus communis]|uniref:Solute carrier family 35 member F1-like n=1 Tax=Pyrus ussuriensis x Pyrus communis TaxID=2448454 RepID=A0A5N5FXA2_9ROSA|nr:solute carrier family 35 member F1-like [Pyrus ussuriensis x Pyrus communis]
MNSFVSSATNWWRSHGTLRTLYLLLLGQLVSFVLAMMSFTSSLIASLGVDAPITQTIPTYLGLALVYGSILLYRREKLRVSWYWYVLLGFVDVQGNYLVNKAYQFSSITSVTLLDCFTIAWVLLLTWIFLGTRYSLWQLFGSAICVVGLGLVLLSDAGVGGGGGSKPLLGDILVIAGTIFFAMSNVGEEFCVKKKDRVEVICMIGTYGFLVSVCQMSILELQTLESIVWSADIILAWAGYTLAGILFYTITPFVLKRSGATLLNLSILTSDMWAVVVRIFFYRQQVDWLYYVAFSVVVIGLIIYSLTEKDPAPVTSLENGNPSLEYRVLEDETAASRNESPTAREA